MPSKTSSSQQSVVSKSHMCAWFKRGMPTNTPRFASKQGKPDLKNYYLSDWSATTYEEVVPSYKRADQITWDGNGKKFFHSCVHTTQEWSCRYPTQSRAFDAYLYSSLHPNNSVSGRCTQTRWTNAPFGGQHPSPILPAPESAPQLDWRAAWNALLDDAYGLMPDDISVGVNVAQLSQLRNLVPSLTRSITNLVRWARGQGNKKIRVWRYLYDKSGKRIPWTAWQTTVEIRSMKWSLREIADLHLVTSFGVLPLADDVANWATKFLGVQMHMNAWMAHTGRYVTLRGKTPVVRSRSETPEVQVASGTYYDTFKKSLAESSAYGIIGASVYVRPKMWEDRCSAMIRQVLGLNVPLQVAWDLVPFSFVVDWFLPVGEVIRRIEPRRFIGGLAASVEIRRVWYSMYKDATSETRYIGKDKPYYAYVLTRFDGDMVVKTKSSYYSRQRGMPVLNWLPKRKTRYGIKQVLLSASLAVQRLIKR